MKSAARMLLLLSIALAGDAPPSEFRIFAAGKNATSKGDFLFDEKAAVSVMSAYVEHGTDMMVDYDHASVQPLSLDPAQAGKAAAWFGLALRDGELWAVNVRWTEPAAAALSRKEWRYMSPAFQIDKDGRVTRLMNVALTNLPATHRLEPLMAASARGDTAMTLEEFLKVVKALGIDMGTPLDEAMAKIKGDSDASTEDAPPPAGDGGADEGTEGAPGAAPPMAAADKGAELVACARFMSLSGKKTLVEAFAEAEVWRASHIKLETETQKLAAERAIMESAERRKGCAELVVAGVRKPAEVWADDKATTPKGYLASMPIADFKLYVAAALATMSGKKKDPPTPPASGGEGDPTHGLTERELQLCTERKIDPAVYAKTRAAIKARSSNVKQQGA